uniref:Large ribosomal subunit protein bL35m n=1 Tax=Anser brachyrhynchus TaxID=132585 RepID=A0A8B9C5E6_9AVES
SNRRVWTTRGNQHFLPLSPLQALADLLIYNRVRETTFSGLVFWLNFHSLLKPWVCGTVTSAHLEISLLVPFLFYFPPFFFFRVTPLLPTILQQPVRTVTYYSLRKGKRKTVKAVIDRFLRLHNGLWVRRKSGYKKKLWKKSSAQKKRLREMVLCTRTQCKLLDKMTTSFWKRRNWYVDDPYQKYHDRTNLRV